MNHISNSVRTTQRTKSISTIGTGLFHIVMETIAADYEYYAEHLDTLRS